MITIKNGEERTVTFTLGESLTVSELGTPTVILSQDRRTDALEIVNLFGGTIEARIPSSLSLLLVAGLDTYIQLSFNDGNGGVVVFPEEQIQVEEQFNEIVVDPVVVEDAEEDLNVEVPDDDYDDDGEQLDEYQEYVEPEEGSDEEEAYADDEDYEDTGAYSEFVEMGEDGEIEEDDFEDEDEGEE